MRRAGTRSPRRRRTTGGPRGGSRGATKAHAGRLRPLRSAIRGQSRQGQGAGEGGHARRGTRCRAARHFRPGRRARGRVRPPPRGRDLVRPRLARGGGRTPPRDRGRRERRRRGEVEGSAEARGVDRRDDGVGRGDGRQGRQGASAFGGGCLDPRVGAAVARIVRPPPRPGAPPRSSRAPPPRPRGRRRRPRAPGAVVEGAAYYRRIRRWGSW